MPYIPKEERHRFGTTRLSQLSWIYEQIYRNIKRDKKAQDSPRRPVYMSDVDDYERRQEQRLGISNPSGTSTNTGNTGGNQQRPGVNNSSSTSTNTGNSGGNQQRPGINNSSSRPVYMSDVDDYERRQEQRLGIPRKPVYMSDVNDYEDRQEQRLGIKNTARNSGQSGVGVDQRSDYVENKTGDSESRPTSVAPVLKPLTVGQRLDAEDRIATESDENLRGVLIALLGEGLPPEDRFEEFLSQFAAWDQDEETNQRMLGLLEEIAYSNWDAYLAESDDLPYLNEGTREYLEKHFPEESLTTRDELQTFFQERLTYFVPEFDTVEIQWDTLNIEELVLVYHAALKTGLEKLYLDKHNLLYREEDRRRVAPELRFIEGLQNVVAKTPLEDKGILLATLGWEEEEEHAVGYFRDQIEHVYRGLGENLPENWTDYQDVVVLANMLYNGVKRIKSRQKSDEDFLSLYDPASKVFYDEYYRTGGRDLDEEFHLLSGNESLDLYPLFRFAVGFIEPIDMLLTIGEVYNSLVIEGDLGEAARNAMGFLPLVPSGIAKFAGRSDFLDDTEYLLGKGMTGYGIYNLVDRGDGPIAPIGSLDGLLEEIHITATESEEVPDGWTEKDWYEFMALFKPAGQISRDELVAALAVGFYKTIEQT